MDQELGVTFLAKTTHSSTSANHVPSVAVGPGSSTSWHGGVGRFKSTGPDQEQEDLAEILCKGCGLSRRLVRNDRFTRMDRSLKRAVRGQLSVFWQKRPSLRLRWVDPGDRLAMMLFMVEKMDDIRGQRTVDHGCLPAWKSAELPAPLPFSMGNVVRTVGPGAILLAGSIGGGEWIVGPLVAVTYGSGILWIATVGIVLQMLFNLEAVRYTLYTGEPVLTGILRLSPGPKLWAPFYIFIGVVQLAVPAMALGCANVIFSAFTGDLPDAQGVNATTLLWIAYGMLAVTVVILLSGRSIEVMLERLSWLMIVLIFSFLIVANVLFVPGAQWMDTLKGFCIPSALPEDYDIMLLALLAATAGSGGLGNLAIANWVRDKGFGMGAHTGGIGGVLRKGHQELATTGYTFPMTDTNLQRWRDWWKYAVADQTGLWAVGCAVGMFLNVNIAVQLIPADADLHGYAAGAFQAKFMAQSLWHGFWFLCLMNGFWVLLSTQIGNTDVLVRTTSDICWVSWPGLQRYGVSKLYACTLAAVITWGVVALAIGENAISLFKVLGTMASPILAIAAIQILRVNTRFLPQPLRPPLWRRIGLLACGLFYGAVAMMLAWKLLRDLFSQLLNS